MSEEYTLGPFETKEQAMLAAEMDDALHGGVVPLTWRVPPSIRSEPSDGHVYRVGGPPWYALYEGPQTSWERDFPSKEEALEACQTDWDERGEENA